MSCAILFSNPSPSWFDNSILPGSAQTVSDLSGAAHAAPLSANPASRQAGRERITVFKIAVLNIAISKDWTVAAGKVSPAAVNCRRAPCTKNPVALTTGYIFEAQGCVSFLL